MNSTLNDSLIFAPQGNRSRVMKAMAQQLLQVMSNRSFFFLFNRKVHVRLLKHPLSYPHPQLTHMCILYILYQLFSILVTLNIQIQK